MTMQIAISKIAQNTGDVEKAEEENLLVEWGSAELDSWDEMPDLWGEDNDAATRVDKRDSEILVREAEAKGNYKQVLEKALARKNEYFRLHTEKISNIKEIVNLPAEGEQYRLITQKHFNTFSFILYILEYHKVIDDLDIITFNMNELTISALTELLDKDVVGRLRIVISDSVKFRMPKRVEQLRAEYEKRKGSKKFGTVFLWNHAKIALVRCGTAHYIIEGSGNFSSNAEIEQYVFENNKAMYEFHKQWISESLFDERAGVRREILD